ncbi:MAG: ribosome biogenesis GTP-binding protein YihA/YsxC [Clostridia bacterium]
MLNNVNFETSVFSEDKLIITDKKQIVLVGKSNVGKSSFINTICNQKRLAKVGNTPGKTKCLNYYNVDDNYYIVDLPGYGYSTMSKSEKDNTSKLIDSYLSTNMITHIFFLVDIRHDATTNDKLMYEYLLTFHIPFTIIANKADKLAKTKIDKYVMNITKTLFAKEEIIPFSTENKLNLDLVESKIRELVNID